MRRQFVWVLFASLVWAGCGQSDSPPPVSGPAAQTETYQPPKVVALGRLQPSNGVLAISALPGERVEALHVEDGSCVEAGDELGKLSSHALRSAEFSALARKLELAPQRWQQQRAVGKARVAQSEAAWEQAQAKREEIAAREEALRLTALQAARAEASYSILSGLDEEDPELASQRELSRYELLSKKAAVDHAQARAQFEAALKVAIATERAALADKEAAEAALADLDLADPTPDLKDQLKAAKLQLDQSLLIAPVSGRVLKVHTQPGEHVAQRPVLEMANLDTMYCVAEVYEADAHKLRAEERDASGNVTQAGDRARVASKAFSGQFASRGIWGTVVEVGRYVAPPGLQSRNPLAPVDRSIVEVRVRIDSTRDGGAICATESAGESSDAPAERDDTMQAAELVSLQVKVEFFEPDKAAVPKPNAVSKRPADTNSPASPDESAAN